MSGNSRLKTKLILFLVVFLAAIVFGLLWAFLGASGRPAGPFAWYLFSYAMGLTMIVLPCTLPLAFVIVPLAMGKGMAKGFGLALAFGIGVALILSFYGVLAAVVGRVAIGTLAAPLEMVKNWVYFIAGIFAYLFALGELGLIRFRLPSYTGAAPAFIQRQGDYFKALLLGLFLGNIGVGCPHPATPLILTEIASSGDIFYGWTLFLVHAIGRVLPLLFLALLGILGVNALSWLVARKDKVERATGWAMVFVAGFILVLGLFTHDWWVNSGIHTWLEEVTQEERFLGVISQRIQASAPHRHGPEEGAGLFGLPLEWGSWVLVLLWLVPLWWYHWRRRRTIVELSDEQKMIEEKIRPWRFWLFASLSLLLAIVFVYILPDRFLRQAVADDDGHDATEEMMEPMGQIGHGEVAHEEAEAITEGLAVDLTIEPETPAAGATSTLNFWVRQRPANALLPAETLEIKHEKLMHVIGVRSDLEQFLHIHPEPASPSQGGPAGEEGLLIVSYVFPQPGEYKLWAEVTRGGVTHTFGQRPITVSGAEPVPSAEINLGRNVIIGDYQVALAAPEPLQAGRPETLSFDIHTLGGEAVALENYLGEPMHLAVIKADWTQFLHTHPAGADDHHSLLPRARAHGPTGARINFETVFPEPGLYRAFAQFRPQGISLPPDESLTAPFWLRVTAQTAAPPPEAEPLGQRLGWWPKLLISLVLIVILSLVVRRFVTVK